MAERGLSPAAILVLADGSLPSQTAASVAIKIARSHSLAIRGLNIVEEALILKTYTNYHKELAFGGIPESRAELVNWFQIQGELALRWLEVQCRYAQVPVTTEVMFGGMPDLVYQQENQVALLALGRRGRGGWNKTGSLGHHFRAIAHHAHIPLLVGGRRRRSLQNVLLVYEAGEHGRRGLAWTIRLNRSLSTGVAVLVFPGSGAVPENFGAKLARSGLATFDLIRGDERSAETILRVAESSRADLIVMSGYHHNALVSKILRSALEGVLARTALPVLVA